MTQRLCLLVAAFVLAVTSLTLAADPAKPDEGSDDAPLRLKKKNKPPLPVPGKDDLDKKPVSEDQPPVDEAKDESRPARDGGPDDRAVQGEDFQNVLERIGKNMRLAEDRLDNKELGDGLHSIQDDIMKDLDSLIKRQQEQQQQQSGMAASGASVPKRGDSSQAGTRQEQRQRIARGMRNQPRPKGQGPDQVARNDKPAGSSSGSGSQTNSTGSRPEGNKGSTVNPLTEIFKDIWGHLPASKRAEMDSYARESFMPKYDALIKKYYSTLSEMKRREAEEK